MLEERISSLCVLRCAQACDMLQDYYGNRKPSVTTTETFDLAVWVYDLNAPGTPSQQVVLNANGALLNQGAALTVPLIEDAAGNVFPSGPLSR